MKKWVQGCLFLAIILVLASCATSKKGVVLGTDGIAQPDWVFKSVVSQQKHYESGYGKMSDRNTSIKRATVEAKNKIAQWLNTQVKEVVTTYTSDSGSENNRQALDTFEIISVQVAEATLSGVTTEEMWIDAEGGVWVLCSIPLDSIEKSFLEAANGQDFMQHEAAYAKMEEALKRHFAY
ncbi:MAG: hypothetical protein ACOXZ4_01665 [Sphaerochaetaceae bacterium]